MTIGRGIEVSGSGSFWPCFGDLRGAAFDETGEVESLAAGVGNGFGPVWGSGPMVTGGDHSFLRSCPAGQCDIRIVPLADGLTKERQPLAIVRNSLDLKLGS